MNVRSAVSLPGDLFNKTDVEACEAHESRSSFLVSALEDYLELVESERLTQRFNEVYAHQPLDPGDKAWMDFALREQMRRIDNEDGPWPTD